MIIGVGADLVDIARIRGAVERHGTRFCERILCPGELESYKMLGESANYLAKRFAAKEAVGKALGTGLGKVSWQDIETRHGPGGLPQVLLHNHARERLERLGASRVLLSLSDEKAYALAFALLQS